MNLGDILKTVGTGLIASIAGPAAPLIIAGINGFLPGDKQLPENATGEQAQSAIDELSPELRASVLEKQYDVKIEHIKQSYGALNTMLSANAESKHTTRPKIAYQAWLVVGFVTLMFGSSHFYAVVTGDVDMIKALEGSYMFVGFLLAPLIVWLNAYFGVLTNESKDRLNAAQGHKVDPVSGLIGKLFKK